MGQISWPGVSNWRKVSNSGGARSVIAGANVDGPGVTAVSFSPANLFTGGIKGAWFDPSDFSTMWQDSGRTTPVTAVEQPVGALNDKSGNANHATQATAGNRPTLRARYNLLTQSVLAGAVAGTPGTPPTGWGLSNSGGSIVSTAAYNANDNVIAVSAAANKQTFFQTTATIPINAVFSFSVVVVANPNSFQIQDLIGYAGTLTNSTQAYFINGGAVAASAVPNAGDRIADVITTSGTFTPAAIQCRFGAGVTNAVTGQCSLAQPQFEQKPLPTPYQWIAAATVYNTSGFLPYLEFNGTSSRLATASIDFSTTAQATAFSGFNKQSDAATGAVFTSGSYGAAGTFGLAAPNGAAANIAGGLNGATAGFFSAAITYTSPITLVATISYDLAAAINANIVTRVNGSNVSTAATGAMGGGNLTAGVINIGDYQTGVNFFNGNIYSLIVRGASSTAAEIAATESWVNARTGAY